MNPSPVAASPILLLAALWVGCANRGQEVVSLPGSVTGCYQLELWPDQTGAEAEAKRAEWNVPSIVRLDSARFTEWPSLIDRYGDAVYRAHGWWEGRWQDHPFAYWRPQGADSLYVGHPGALAGVSLVLEARGDALNGVITAYTDVRQMGDTAAARPSAPVRARRSECPGSEP